MVAWRSTATAVLVVGALMGLPEDTTVAVDAGASVGPERPVVGTTTARVIDPPGAASPPATVVLDPAWNTGFYTSAVVDGSGTTHVAYYADGSGAVMLASCAAVCESPSLRQLAPVAGVGTDLVRVGDGLAVSFIDLDTRTVKVAFCPDSGCDVVQVRPVAAVDAVGATRLAHTSAGDLVVAYPALGGGVAVARCRGTDCRTPSRLLLAGTAHDVDLAAGTDGTVWVAHRGVHGHLVASRCSPSACAEVARSDARGVFPSIATSRRGEVGLSYHAADTHQLRLITCRVGAPCTDVVVDETDDSGYFSGLVWRRSGLPLIAHHGQSPAALVVADCRTRDCTVVTRNVVDRLGAPGEHLSLAIGAAGSPKIAHHDALSRTLRLTSCGDPGCAAPPGSEGGASGVSVGLDADGVPVVAWRHPTTMDLRLSRCVSGPCPEGAPIDSGGDVGLRPALGISAEHRVAVAHQGARDRGLRLVTCEAACEDATAVPVPTRTPLDQLAIVPGPDAVPTIVATRPQGLVTSGRCADAVCRRVEWTPVGQGRAGGPLAATALSGSDGIAVAYLDDSGVRLAWCLSTCRTFLLAPGDVTAIGLATTDRDVVGVLRHADGTVSLHRCDPTSCRSAGPAVPRGNYGHAAVAATGAQVTVGLVSMGGSVQMLDCTRDCTLMGERVVPEPVWALDMASGGASTVLAALAPGGPWVMACDASGCSAGDAGASDDAPRPSGFIRNQ